MSALPVQVSVLPDVAGVSQAKTSEQDVVDGFLALLDIVDARLGDEDARPDSRDTRRQPLPVAVPVDLHTAVFADVRPVPRREEASSFDDAAPVTNDAAAQDTLPPELVAPPRASDKAEPPSLPENKAEKPALPVRAANDTSSAN